MPNKKSTVNIGAIAAIISAHVPMSDHEECTKAAKLIVKAIRTGEIEGIAMKHPIEYTNNEG